jgi:hypothetical protein
MRTASQRDREEKETVTEADLALCTIDLKHRDIALAVNFISWWVPA